MKLISRAFLPCCLLLLTACPALAELSATFINRTDFEIQSVSIQGDGGGMGSTIRVVPGNFCVFTDGNSSELREVRIDAGLMLFTFTDMQAVAGMSAPTFELSFDADNRPHLTLVDKAAQGDGDAQGDADAQGASFDLPAGPIWNNDHAKERCPEVLEEWLAANPGRQAQWNGNWATVTLGEMSVCGMTPIGENAASAPDAVPSLINVVGEVTVFADPAAPCETDFGAIINAETMAEIRAMGAQDSTEWSSQVYLPAAFAGNTWAVFVEPEETFSQDPKAKPGDCNLRTYAAADGLAPLLRGLADAGYRPWFAQLMTGEDMDTESMARFWQEELDAAEAWEQLAEACEEINREGEPAAVDVVLLSEEGYARAASGEDAEMPGFRLRVSNAVVVTLRYHTDISSLLGMTR